MLTSFLLAGDPVLAVRVALPLESAAPYVAAAYGAFLILIGIYIGIMARKQRARQRQVTELLALMRERRAGEKEPDTGGEALGVQHRRR